MVSQFSAHRFAPVFGTLPADREDWKMLAGTGSALTLHGLLNFMYDGGTDLDYYLLNKQLENPFQI